MIDTTDTETHLVVIQRDSTTTLSPLVTAGILTLTHEAGLPGPKGDPGITTVIHTGDSSTPEFYDPGDLTLYFENGLI